MNPGQSSCVPLGDAPCTTQEEVEDGDIRKCDYPRNRSSSFIKIKRLVVAQVANACQFGVFMFFLFGLVSTGTICLAVGIQNVNDCPLQKYIPVYLIAEGVLMLLSLPHVVLNGSGSENNLYADIISLVYKISLIVSEICVLVLGTAAIYSALPPNFDPSQGPHCSKICFLAAFFLVTVTWMFILVTTVVAALVICCFFVCKATPANNPAPARA